MGKPVKPISLDPSFPTFSRTMADRPMRTTKTRMRRRRMKRKRIRSGATVTTRRKGTERGTHLHYNFHFSAKI